MTADAATRHEALIEALTRDLRPVRRLLPPWVRVAGWLAAVVGVGVLLAPLADFDQLQRRLAAVPDMWLAVLGSTLTGILAAVAAFETSLPDRSPRWALLPVPPLLLWIGACGLGCLRSWVIPGVHPAPMSETPSCLLFIVGLSVPLSLLMVFMLRRAFALRPGLTVALGGLAAAAAAATLLNLFHPYDASATDLTAHALAVLAVIAANRALARPALRLSR